MNNTDEIKKKKIVNKKSKKIYIPHYGLTDVDVKNVINELEKWSDLPQSYSMLGFCATLGIQAQRYYDWIDSYPEIAEAHGIARTKINNRLIVDGLTRVAESNMVRQMKPTHQDRDIRQSIEWETKLKEGNDKDTNINLIIPPFPKPEQLEKS